MRRRLLLLLALLLPALLRADDAPNNADKDLEGDWELKSVIRDGQKQFRTLDKGGPLFAMFRGDSLSFNTDVEIRKVTIKVDASKTPKTIDLIPDDGPQKGKTMKGIYEVTGDELRVCHADSGKDRLTALSAKEGSGWTLMTFKRVKK